MVKLTKIAVGAWALGLATVLLIDPFVIGNAWWRLDADGVSEAIELYALLLFNLAFWTLGAMAFALTLGRLTHPLATWATAFAVFGSAVFPGIACALLLHDHFGSSASQTSASITVCPPALAVSIVLWVMYAVYCFVRRRGAAAPSSAQ